MKQYIALRNSEDSPAKLPYMLNENDLAKWLKNESLKDGDEVYEVVLYGKVKRTTEIIFEKQ